MFDDNNINYKKDCDEQIEELIIGYFWDKFLSFLTF